MTYEKLEEELSEWNGDCYFVSLLDEFVWSETFKRVESYATEVLPNNEVKVYKTELIDLKKKSLLEYFKSEEITEKDVLVFCINEEYIPPKGNFIRLKVFKNINKKENEIKRLSTGD